MYKLKKVYNSQKENDLFETMYSINSSLFKENADMSVCFLDIDSMLSITTTEMLDSIRRWFSMVDFEKSIIIVNVDVTKSINNAVWNFIYNIINMESETDNKPAIVISKVLEISMSNYAQLRFGYNDKFVAKSMKNIKKICELLGAHVSPNTIYTINEDE